MLRVFLFTFILLLGETVLSLAAGGIRRDKAAFWFVPTLIQVFFWNCFFASLFYLRIDFGTVRWLAVSALSVLAASIVNRWGLKSSTDSEAKFPIKLLLFIMALAILSEVDVFWLHLRNGLNFISSQPYISNTPVNIDIERTIVLISDILREKFDLKYHSFWLHGAAHFLSIFQAEESGWQNATGIFLVTGVLHFATIFWLVAIVRRSVFSSYFQTAVIFILLFCHAEVIYAALNLIFEHQIGQSSTGTFAESVLRHYEFRSFSSKASTFISPQHTVFLSLLGVYLGLFEKSSGRVLEKFDPLSTFFLMAAFLASPILFFIFFSVFFPVLCLTSENRRQTFRFLVVYLLPVGVILFFLFRLAFGMWVHDLYLNNPGGSTLMIPMPPGMWRSAGWLLPVIYFVSTGVLAVAIAISFIYSKFSRFGNARPGRLGRVILWTIPAGLVIYGPLICDSLLELQRHQVIVLTLTSVVALAAYLPRLNDRLSRGIFAALCVLAIVLHVDFVGAYGLARNWLDPRISYGDYFEVIKRASRARPDAGILSSSYNGAVIYSLPMRFTESFGNPQHSLMSGHFNQKQVTRLKEINAKSDSFFSSGQHIQFAQELGFSYVLWGPLEEKAWGPALRDLYLRDQPIVDQVGAVALFSLSNTISGEGESYREFSRTLAGLSGLRLAYLQSLYRGETPLPDENDVTTLESVRRFLRPLYSFEPFVYRKLYFYERGLVGSYLVFEPWNDKFVAYLRMPIERIRDFEISDNPISSGLKLPPLMILADNPTELIRKIRESEKARLETHFYYGNYYQQLRDETWVSSPRVWSSAKVQETRLYPRARSLEDLWRKIEREERPAKSFIANSKSGLKIEKFGDIFLAFPAETEGVDIRAAEQGGAPNLRSAFSLDGLGLKN